MDINDCIETDDDTPTLIDENLGIAVIIEKAPGSKCMRCWKYCMECKYDEDRGCTNLLCNRCVAALEKDFPDFPAFLHFKNERAEIFGKNNVDTPSVNI